MKMKTSQIHLRTFTYSLTVFTCPLLEFGLFRCKYIITNLSQTEGIITIKTPTRITITFQYGNTLRKSNGEKCKMIILLVSCVKSGTDGRRLLAYLNHRIRAGRTFEGSLSALLFWLHMRIPTTTFKMQILRPHSKTTNSESLRLGHSNQYF